MIARRAMTTQSKKRVTLPGHRQPTGALMALVQVAIAKTEVQLSMDALLDHPLYGGASQVISLRACREWMRLISLRVQRVIQGCS